jgi:hypothetical protein
MVGKAVDKKCFNYHMISDKRCSSRQRGGPEKRQGNPSTFDMT